MQSNGNLVVPAQAGTQVVVGSLDPGLRRGDDVSMMFNHYH